MYLIISVNVIHNIFFNFNIRFKLAIKYTFNTLSIFHIYHPPNHERMFFNKQTRID